MVPAAHLMLVSRALCRFPYPSKVAARPLRLLMRQINTRCEYTSEYINLADEGLGARPLFATDEWFAVASNLLKSSAAHWDSETFDDFGKTMDGWETRRRRLPGHNWAIIRLGLAGRVKQVEIDTAHFTGNHVPAVRVLAADINTGPTRASHDDDDTTWLGALRPTLGQQGSCASPEEIAQARQRVEQVRPHASSPVARAPR